MSRSRRNVSTDKAVLITQETQSKPVEKPVEKPAVINKAAEQKPEIKDEKQPDLFPKEQVMDRIPRQPPSIGRIVVFVPRETDEEYSGDTVGVITRVTDKDCSKVNLFVLGDYKTGFRHNIAFDDKESEVGYWKWPERI